ncbi:hypothetical protein Y900_013535 [Mycolicibacterium aromaticivorans JS19b1 = JCM 16368]|uniref:Transmembrane protein n=1 Tax=Mycolicibacterium aromaticivorans JS19b1 = JCM 16368 TaxID=1440774 RepID=A0A064CH71_9MYCO|nr:hypothetical protein Y900_013535 [Mycolicibacterium aromaticivorans JS19b1 = JCM 16368]
MRIVVAVALAGLIALVVAVLTDSTYAAIAVVVLAVVGIVLLLRDWRADRKRAAAGESTEAPHEPVDPSISPELFAPDISADGRGPSSDARAD